MIFQISQPLWLLYCGSLVTHALTHRKYNKNTEFVQEPQQRSMDYKIKKN